MKRNHPKRELPIWSWELLVFLAVTRIAAFEASSAGTVVGWGDNGSGQATGIPVSGQSTGVVIIAGRTLTNVAAIAAGMNHSLAVRDDGTVLGWGLNGNGEATGSKSSYPGSGSGIVATNGEQLTNAVTVAAGWGHSQAIKKDGSAVAWGAMIDGRPSALSVGIENVKSVTGWSSFAVGGNGAIVDLFNGEIVAGISNVVAVAAPRTLRSTYLLGLRRDGTVLGIRVIKPSSYSVITSNAAAIAAGGWQNLALKRDGTVFAWGSHSNVPPGLSNVVAISAGEYHSLALKSDGTVVAWGATDQPGAQVPAGLSNVVAIAAGNNFSLAITTNPAVATRFMQEVK